MKWIGIENGFLSLLHDILDAPAVDAMDDDMDEEWINAAPSLAEIEAACEELEDLEMELIDDEYALVAG